MSKKFGLGFIETSAKEDINVKTAFMNLMEIMVEKVNIFMHYSLNVHNSNMWHSIKH